jgi:hypothetical protein
MVAMTDYIQQLPAKIAEAVATARLPKAYERARQALAECDRIDRCKEWADKAAALASYARQADDPQLENYARRIRARAVRRCGELLREIEPGKPGPKSISARTQNSRSQAARDAGLSDRQKVTALRIAAIAEDEFEAAVESPRPPGTTLLAQIGKVSRPPVDPVRTFTGRELNGVMKRSVAGRVIDSLLRLAGSAEDRWRDLDLVLELLLDEANVGKVDAVRRGISFAIRIKGALDQVGVRGNPLLKLIE